MSGGAQRYVPPRDRSPRDRTSSFANSSASRDPLARDSRISSDTVRPSYGGSSYAPRGGRGGFSSRSDYRPDYRDREPLRDRRDTSPYSSLERDRNWRDRDSDRGRSPPPLRPRDRDFRDFRDASRGRPRRGSFDSDFSGPTYSRGRGSSFGPSPPARAGSFRGRGRGDWEPRGRGRGYPPDERGDLFRPRSRSPRRWADDDRSISRRDDYRPPPRDERPRDDRYRDASPPARGPPLTRRPSLPSISTTSTTASPATSGQPQSARPYDVRDGRDSRDGRDGPRRPSAINSAEPRELIRDSPRNADPPSSRSHAQSNLPPPPRVNSPPKPTEIPAFGSVPVKPAQAEGWNVWKAPAEPKPAPKTPSVATEKSKTPDVAPSRSDLPAQPPTAPRALIQQESRPTPAPPAANGPAVLTSQPAAQRNVASVQLPTAPAAEREAGSNSLAKSPPTGPRFAHTPSGPRASVRHDAAPPSIRSPPIPAAIPTGPRGSTPSMTTASGIPTGPRADRATPSHSSNRAPPTGPSSMPSWQRPRGPPGSASQSTSPLIPAKRDNQGEPKEHRSASPQRGTTRLPSPKKSTDALDQDKPKSRAASVGVPLSLIPTQQALEEEYDDDSMDEFNEKDSERAEAEFLRKKASLEAQMIDVDTAHMRADDILERLALLHALAIRDPASLVSKRGDDAVAADSTNKADAGDGVKASGDMLTPKTEDKDPTETPADVEMTLIPAPESPGFRDESATPSTPDRLATPDLDGLPFLNREPITPISELDAYQDTLAKHEAMHDAMHMKLVERTKDRFDTHEANCKRYAQIYRAWRLEVREIERDRAQHDREDTVDEAVPAEVAPDPSLLTPATATGEGSRSRSRYTSEYSLEQALKKSQETAKAEQAQREREEAQAKRDPGKEADIPEMLPHGEVYAETFKDTAHRRDPADAVEFWHLQPPKDNFTPEEHQTMLDNYRLYPKKWGKIGSALAGRTYKDCINHYYATKWNKEFKPKVKTKTRKSGKASKGPGGAKSLRANHLLNDVGVDVYGADDAAAPLVSRTTGGRPKRAAAPTSFNDTDPASVGNKRGGRPTAAGEPNTEKPARKIKGAPRSGPTQRKSGRQAARQRSPSPSKTDTGAEARAPDPGSTPAAYTAPKELNVPGTLAAMANAPPHHNVMLRGPGDMRYGQVQDLIGPSQGLGGPGDGGRPPTMAQQRGTPSSYWSVQETTKFPELLENFGTDWQGIANHMGTKSATMVKNYYSRLLSNGRTDLAEIAARADDERKAMDRTMPVQPAMSASPMKQRSDQIPAGSATSRLLPRKEIIDIEDDSPGVRSSGADYAARYGPFGTAQAPPPHVAGQPAPSAVEALRPGSVGKPRDAVDWSQGVQRAPRREPDYPSPFAESNRYMGERPDPADFYRGERAAMRHEEEPAPLLDFRRSSHAATAAISSRQKTYDSERPVPTFGRSTPSSSERLWAPASRPEVLQPSPADRMAGRMGPTHASMGQYARQSPPQPRMPAYSPTHTPSYTPARPVEITSRGEPARPADKMHSHGSVYGQEPHRPPRSGPSTPFYESAGRPSYPPLDDRRAAPAPAAGSSMAPARNQTPASQPSKPKQSSLLALLNPEPDDPKPNRSLPPPAAAMSRTRTPPVPTSMYGSHGAPPRPSSRMERPSEQHYGDSRGMSSSYQPGPLSHLGHGSPPMASHDLARPHSSLRDRPPAIMQPSTQPPPQHPYGRMDTPSMLNRSGPPPMSSLRSPAHNASPPPQSHGYAAPPPPLHAPRGMHARETSYSRGPPGAYSDRRETYGERPYGAPPHHPASMTPQPTYGSPFPAAAAPPPPPPPPPGPARYPPLGNQESHAHNTGLVPSYGPRDPAGARNYGGDPFDRERRERREREQLQHQQMEAERSRQYAPPGSGSGGGPAGGASHSGYAYIPGRDR